MNVKALALIFLVIFASAATVFVVGLSSSRVTEESVGSTKSHSIVQIDNETVVQPNGPIDCPGMPG
jgi:uncharacterized protein YwlG (UPF0340 family)